MAERDENALPEGSLLKHGGAEYRIERFLGAGGFGITYLVRGGLSRGHQSQGLYFAIKEHFMRQDCEREHDSHRVVCSKPARERVEEGKKDFIAEAKRLRDKISHSHIVRVRDVFEANNTAYYVMEFLDGMSLRSYVRRHGALKEEETVSMLLPIACALGYLHDNRITHLDIKPDNIMIVERGDREVFPILIDFGLSKHYDKAGQPTSTIKVQATSDGYSPLEQYQGINDFQPTADIYALCATFVYCLTAKDPKRSADLRLGELKALLEGKISAEKLTSLLKGMSPSRYDRTQSVRELLRGICPGQDFLEWDSDNSNATTPIYFKTKKKASFVSKLKSLFSNKTRLPIPDNWVEIELIVPKSSGEYSRRLKFNRDYAEFEIVDSCYVNDFGNTCYNILWSRTVRFEEWLPQEVVSYFRNYRLLEKEHWEYERPLTGGPDSSYVSILFGYKNGQTYKRSNRNFYYCYPTELCKTIKNLLYSIPSINNVFEEGTNEIETEILTKAKEAYDNENYSLAMELLLKIRNNAEAQNFLGVMYDFGEGVEIDSKTAVEWYRKAAEQGHADAQCSLGFMYDNGYGVSKNIEEAKKWYQMAAEQGNAVAQYNLGFMYKYGYGVEKDYKTAVEWYRKAAEQGHALAQNNLGVMYENGYGVSKNIEEAKKWYQMAAEQGHENAKKSLDRLGEAN